MHSLKISIITPSFNQSSFLEHTLRSVREQQYPNLEYIVIDGGSTDGSVDIIRKYEKHISFWVSEKDKGQAAAINKGFRKATGDIITWLNSDDLLVPGTLTTVDQYFRSSEAGLIHGKTILFGDIKKETVKCADGTDTVLKCLGGMPFPQPSVFFKRKILDSVGMLDESLHYGMDCDLFARIALNFKILQVKDIFSKYRLHPSSKSGSGSIPFAKDWAVVFSRVLRSFPFTDEEIEWAQQAGLYCEGDSVYPVSNNFTKKNLRKSLLYFLKNQAYSYYEDLNLKKTKKILDIIKQADAGFYKSNKLNTLHLRAGLLPAQSVRLARKITRS